MSFRLNQTGSESCPAIILYLINLRKFIFVSSSVDVLSDLQIFSFDVHKPCKVGPIYCIYFIIKLSTRERVWNSLLNSLFPLVAEKLFRDRENMSLGTAGGHPQGDNTLTCVLKSDWGLEKEGDRKYSRVKFFPRDFSVRRAGTMNIRSMSGVSRKFFYWCEYMCAWMCVCECLFVCVSKYIRRTLEFGNKYQNKKSTC